MYHTTHTLTPPSDSKFDSTFSHAHRRSYTHTSIQQPLPPANDPYSPPKTVRSLVMTTPHRGLPPPGGLALPDPSRGPPSIPPPHSLNQLPPPPSSQWQGTEEMRSWLCARAEDDKRHQELERTRQEELKLEQRRIEQSVLRDALHAGVPPHLVPLIFAGMGGSALGGVTAELAQQHIAQLSTQPLQAYLPHSPQQRRDQVLVGQQPYPPHQPPANSVQAAAPGAPVPPPTAQAAVYPSPAYQSPRSTAVYASPAYGAPASAIRNPVQAALPRLTTNEVSTAQPSTYTHHGEQPSTSPSLYFHHWQPPATQGTGKESQKTSPNARPPTSSEEQRNSPRKRKNTNAHQSVPPPRPNSPAFSTTSTTSTKSRRPNHANDRPSEVKRAYDPIERDTRPRNCESSPRRESNLRHSESRASSPQHSRSGPSTQDHA